VSHVKSRECPCRSVGCCAPAEQDVLDGADGCVQVGDIAPFRALPQFNGCVCVCVNTPLCRHHHRAKQAEGWRLQQPEPGVLIWRTPSGRTYATTPTVYPM